MLGWPLLFLLEWVSRPHSEEKRLLRLLVERDIACVRRLTPLSVRAATYRHKTAAWGTGTTFILCVPAIKLTRRLLAGVWGMNTAARWNIDSITLMFSRQLAQVLQESGYKWVISWPKWVISWPKWVISWSKRAISWSKWVISWSKWVIKCWSKLVIS